MIGKNRRSPLAEARKAAESEGVAINQLITLQFQYCRCFGSAAAASFMAWNVEHSLSSIKLSSRTGPRWRGCKRRAVVRTPWCRRTPTPAIIPKASWSLAHK